MWNWWISTALPWCNFVHLAVPRYSWTVTISCWVRPCNGLIYWVRMLRHGLIDKCRVSESYDRYLIDTRLIAVLHSILGLLLANVDRHWWIHRLTDTCTCLACFACFAFNTGFSLRVGDDEPIKNDDVPDDQKGESWHTRSMCTM